MSSPNAERLESSLNTVRLAVRAELVEAHSPFDKLRANELKRTALSQVLQNHISTHKHQGPHQISLTASASNRRAARR